MSTSDKVATIELKLPADLGVAEANTLRLLLADHITRAESVALDAGDVNRVSTAALQLLLVFTSVRDAAGRPTAWQALSKPMAEAITWLGLATRLRVPTELKV